MPTETKKPAPRKKAAPKPKPQKLEHLKTASLVPYARNSRTHSDEQVAQIMASIREFGFTNPVLIDAEGTIIAGHGRVLAATRMELDTVPCIRLSNLTDAQKRAYVIADNRIALSSSWDTDLLANELADLQADDFDLDLLGFEVKELADLLDVSDVTAPDDFKEVDEDIETEHECPKCGYRYSGGTVIALEADEALEPVDS